MSHLKKIAKNFNLDNFKNINEEISFDEYLDKCYKNPRLIRTSHQRIYDMIVSKGTHQFEKYRKTLVHYNFFDDQEIPIFGLEETIDNLMKFIKGAANNLGPEKRILLLHGPVGSSKSTIFRLLKRGLEKYSVTEDGAWYSFKWVNLPTGSDGIYVSEEDPCPMHEEPLKLIPWDIRKNVIEELNGMLKSKTEEKDLSNLYRLNVEGDLDPRCRFFMNFFLKKYKGDWEKIVKNHIVVTRMTYSEVDRCGIATFQPKDEKSQDSTELTGDINFAKISHFGIDSDPRCFSFDGELNIANRGICEFIEMLKLQQEFLYDLLGASQEKAIKPKKFPQISVDMLIGGHTNMPEFQKLKANQHMEALRDRTVRVDVPYLLKVSDEIKVLEQDYSSNKVKQHVAPHTLEIAALWAVLTRLEEDRDNKINLVEKAELYDGKMLSGWTDDSIKEMKDKYPEEGMTGVSARYIQDKISNCLSNNHDYVNPFMVLNELKEGLENNNLISNKDQINKFRNCVDLATKKLDEILKTEVQKALVGDEDAIVRLCGNYIDNVMAYINKSKVKNPYTGREETPDERLMRNIEGKIDIPETGADDFRRMIAAFIGDLAHKGKTFIWNSNPQLKKALEAKLFEDTKDHIKLSALNMSGATVVDSKIQEKIDAVKERLKKQFGYNDQSARDVLDYVGSIFARGDLASK
jgi:serine protein kinase